MLHDTELLEIWKMPFSMSSKAMGFRVSFGCKISNSKAEGWLILLTTGSTMGNKCLKDKFPSEGTCHWGLWGCKIHWDKTSCCLQT